MTRLVLLYCKQIKIRAYLFVHYNTAYKISKKLLVKG